MILSQHVLRPAEQPKPYDRVVAREKKAELDPRVKSTCAQTSALMAAYRDAARRDIGVL